MNPKLLLLLLVFYFSTLQAQDTIYVRNGNLLKAWIAKADEYQIEFKKCNKSQARIYTIRTKDVFAIKYENGKKDVFIAAPREYHGEILSDYDRSMRISKRRINTGIGLTCMGTILFCGGGVLVGFGIDQAQPKNGYNPLGVPLAMVGAIYAAGGLANIIIGPLIIKKSIFRIRNAQQLKSELSFKPVLLPAEQSFGCAPGLGLNLKF